MNLPATFRSLPPIPRGARPDAETHDCVYLIKNVSLLFATQQIRLLAAKAILSSKQLFIVTPAACRFDKSLEELMQSHPEIIRRKELK
ncbi:MAG: hypothetical protein ABSA05_07660 [Opitutaceae bacterium]|jgi:hypothetical protein